MKATKQQLIDLKRRLNDESSINANEMRKSLSSKLMRVLQSGNASNADVIRAALVLCEMHNLRIDATEADAVTAAAEQQMTDQLLGYMTELTCQELSVVTEQLRNPTVCVDTVYGLVEHTLHERRNQDRMNDPDEAPNAIDPALESCSDQDVGQ